MDDATFEFEDDLSKRRFKDQTGDLSAEQLSSGDDVDSLSLYHGELSKSEPITAEEELQCWKAIAEKDQQIRSAVYPFAFVVLEHIKIVDDFENGDGADLFLFPVKEGVSRKGNFNIDSMLAPLKKWRMELSGHYNVMKAAWKEQNLDTLQDERAKLVGLLLKYPVVFEKVHEWINVASFYLDEYDKSPDKVSIFSEKIMMEPETCRNIMNSVRQWTAEKSALQQKIITANLRFVVSIANNYVVPYTTRCDLIQEGNLGMLRAMDRFDYKRGYRFATYAAWWIKQAISSVIYSQSRIIHLPEHMLKDINKINRAEANFILENGRDPTSKELAAILELSCSRVNALKKMMCQPISLQNPKSEEDNFELESLLSSGDDDLLKSLARKLLRTRLEQDLEILSEREQQIIRLRFGLDGETPKNQAEISRIFGLSRERIRQIELRAIKKLKTPALRGYFKEYFSR